MTWRVWLATGRLGDWLYVQAPDEEGALRAAKRRTRKAISHVRPVLDAEGWAEYDRKHGIRKRQRRTKV